MHAKHFQKLPAREIEWAHLAYHPPTFRRASRTERQALGVRYERKVQTAFEQQYPDAYISGPWFVFKDAYGRRLCQPDGLLVDFRRGRITIVEIKYNHTADAWWQLWELYLPIVQHVFPANLWQYRCLEVTKWYDCAVSFPGRIELVRDPLHVSGANVTGIHIFPPRI